MTQGDGTAPGTGGVVPHGHRGGSDGQTNPRLALVEALATALARGAAVGDLDLARVAHDALGRLLGLGAGRGAGGYRLQCPRPSPSLEWPFSSQTCATDHSNQGS
jgi:hypothetical protein